MKELEEVIRGRGEVRDHIFTQKYFDGSWYIYEVSSPQLTEKVHYEVFKRKELKASPPYIPEDLVRYPTAINFGSIAWTAGTYERALEIIKEKDEG